MEDYSFCIMFSVSQGRLARFRTICSSNSANYLLCLGWVVICTCCSCMHVGGAVLLFACMGVLHALLDIDLLLPGYHVCECLYYKI